MLHLPDVVPTLNEASVEICRSELSKNIDKMLTDVPSIQKYLLFLNEFHDIFPAIKFRKGKISKKDIIEKIKIIYKEFGGRVESEGGKNSGRSDFTLHYPCWPRSDFLDDKNWLNTIIPDIGHTAGQDIAAVDDHTTMLKFHIWSINNWFNLYYNHDC